MKTATPYGLTFALAAAVLFFALPPLPQPLDYHEFADPWSCWSLPYCLDFLSNLPIAGVGIVGSWLSWRSPSHVAPGAYRLFFFALIVAGVGSAYYHAAPDNLRLAWDRAGVVLALSAWLAIVFGECCSPRLFRSWPFLTLAGLAAVSFWITSEQAGRGDLRPYLLFQAVAFLWALTALLPATALPARRFHLVTLTLYALALVGDLADRSLAHVLSVVSGHTLKHLFAAAAGAVVVLAWRQTGKR